MRPVRQAPPGQPGPQGVEGPQACDRFNGHQPVTARRDGGAGTTGREPVPTGATGPKGPSGTDGSYGASGIPWHQRGTRRELAGAAGP